MFHFINSVFLPTYSKIFTLNQSTPSPSIGQLFLTCVRSCDSEYKICFLTCLFQCFASNPGMNVKMFFIFFFFCNIMHINLKLICSSAFSLSIKFLLIFLAAPTLPPPPLRTRHEFEEAFCYFFFFLSRELKTNFNYASRL